MPDPLHLQVAHRIAPVWVLTLHADEDAAVRCEVARRAPVERLGLMVRDADCRVRWEIAARALPDVLLRLRDDPVDPVRELAGRRLEEPEFLAEEA